jgi:hypothetical protein
LDDHLREALTYHFKLVSPGTLFLSMAVRRSFEGRTDKVTKGTMYVFDQGGTVQIRRETLTPEHIIETKTDHVDVEPNYSPFPRFGDYDDLIRIERS